MTNTITVQEAITRAIRYIMVPVGIIMYVSAPLSIILSISCWSWLYLLMMPGGIIVSSLYSAIATAKWRLWAYKHVNDIHQLQRSAEIARILQPNSYDQKSLFLSMNENIQLKKLQERFIQDAGFIDDRSIPDETQVYSTSFFSSSNAPEIILNDKGIQVGTEAFVAWNEIRNERVSKSSYRSRNTLTYDTRSGVGGKTVFRFECPLGNYDTPLSSLKISGWKLDLLLYTYRGRYTTNKMRQSIEKI